MLYLLRVHTRQKVKSEHMKDHVNVTDRDQCDVQSLHCSIALFARRCCYHFQFYVWNIQVVLIDWSNICVRISANFDGWVSRMRLFTDITKLDINLLIIGREKVVTKFSRHQKCQHFADFCSDKVLMGLEFKSADFVMSVLSVLYACPQDPSSDIHKIMISNIMILF